MQWEMQRAEIYIAGWSKASCSLGWNACEGRICEFDRPEHVGCCVIRFSRAKQKCLLIRNGTGECLRLVIVR